MGASRFLLHSYLYLDVKYCLKRRKNHKCVEWPSGAILSFLHIESMGYDASGSHVV